jgi:hypothetical protein
MTTPAMKCATFVVTVRVSLDRCWMFAMHEKTGDGKKTELNLNSSDLMLVFLSYAMHEKTCDGEN